MKARKVSAALIAGAALLALTAPALAETTVTATWAGAGNLSFNGTAIGTTSDFVTGGNQTLGSASFYNAENNPYNYGVPSVQVDINAAVGSGGYVQSQVNRTESYAPLYGPSGQSITGYASSDNGSAALVTHTATNYASLSDQGYGKDHTVNGDTLEASGTNIHMSYNVDTGVAGNAAGFVFVGTGSAAVKQNFSGVSGQDFGFGQGGGIYTAANFTAQGKGQFTYGGNATGQLNLSNTGTTVYGTTANPAGFTGILTYDTTAAGVSQTYIDYSISGSKGS